MLRCEDLSSVLVLAPHADDEVLGCGGLLARLAAAVTRVHVVYAAVDGFHHYGHPSDTTYQERLAEIERVAELFGFSWEILYGDKGLIEQLDTLPKRELVDAVEGALNAHRPELLLVATGSDYDQDHVALFDAAFAAARPIPTQFGKWLVPHVLTYEMTKIQWAATPLPLSTAFVALSADDLEAKLEGVRRYATQLRSSPHIRSLESVRALATIRGKEIGVEYAEAFGVLRTVL
jgi:LmbE family N-acetylglucosaminyl deacetylase